MLGKKETFLGTQFDDSDDDDQSLLFRMENNDEIAHSVAFNTKNFINNFSVSVRDRTQREYEQSISIAQMKKENKLLERKRS